MDYVVLHNSAARRARPATLIYVFSTQCLCLSVYFMYYFDFW